MRLEIEGVSSTKSKRALTLPQIIRSGLLIFVIVISSSILVTLNIRRVNSKDPITIRTSFLTGSKEVSRLYPEIGTEHETVDGREMLSIKQAITKFLVNIPSGSTRLRYKIRYKPEEQEVFLITLRSSPVLQDKKTHILLNNGLSETAYETATSRYLPNAVLYQNEYEYSSLGDFINNPPEDGLVGLYHFPWADIIEYTLVSDVDSLKDRQDKLDDEDNEEGKEESEEDGKQTLTELPFSIFGSHTFYMPVIDNKLLIEFSKNDIIESKDSTLYISVKNNDTEVYQTTLGDNQDNDKSHQRHQSINITDIENGVYEIEFRQDPDSSEIKNIRIYPPYITFEDKVRILDTNTRTSQSEIEIFAVGNSFKFAALEVADYMLDDPENLIWTVSAEVHGQEDELEESFTMNEITTLSASSSPKNLKNEHTLYIDKGGFEVAAFLISPSEDMFIYPLSPRVVYLKDNFNIDDYEFILTRYKEPEVDGEWLISEDEFKLDEIGVAGGVHELNFIAPDVRGKKILIDYFEITYER